MAVSVNLREVNRLYMQVFFKGESTEMPSCYIYFGRNERERQLVSVINESFRNPLSDVDRGFLEREAFRFKKSLSFSDRKKARYLFEMLFKIAKLEEDYERAYYCLNEICFLNEDLLCPRMSIFLLESSAEFFKENNKLDKAISSLRQAIRICKEVGDVRKERALLEKLNLSQKEKRMEGIKFRLDELEREEDGPLAGMTREEEIALNKRRLIEIESSLISS